MTLPVPRQALAPRHAPRIVGAIRLSRHHDSSTSPEVQEEMITLAAHRVGGAIVGWAKDIDVSALKTSPWEREELSRWLEHPDEWDVLIWQRMDRAVRSMADMANLGRFAKQHGKRLVFASGPGGDMLELDFSSAMSELIMLILAFAAQLEGQTITERNQGAAARLQSLGRWAGGPVPYGFMPVRKTFPDGNEGWWLGEHAETADVRRQAIARTIAHKSYSSTTEWLSTSGAVTPANHRARLAGRAEDPESRWSSTVVRSMMISDLNRGHLVTRDGTTVRNADGSPVLQGDALISDETSRALKEATVAMAVEVLQAPRRRDAHELLGVLVCHDCVNNMHTGSRTMPDGTRADVFRCNSDRHGKGTPKPTVTKATTLAWVHAEFVERFGFMRRTQIVRTAGVDHRPEIAELEENLHELNGRFPRMRGAAADLVESQMNGISDRLASLQALPIEPPRIQVVELDTTWGDAFIDATDEGKRQIMLDMGVRVTVGPPTGWRRPVEERLVMTIERDDPVRDELDDVAAQELL
ncbi:recombinase family protein [Streptomyces sp. NBC_00986]|uniref:recombinase family protein n=1 Tax=Streptomyces sp. NBC_00986 TaxID=2903702 RepID=UPI0038674092|nr:recombinase family protein [Streptomyces sp. NBC_00986]